jgi:hypothetical protein
MVPFSLGTSGSNLETFNLEEYQQQCTIMRDTYNAMSLEEKQYFLSLFGLSTTITPIQGNISNWIVPRYETQQQQQQIDPSLTSINTSVSSSTPEQQQQQQQLEVLEEQQQQQLALVSGLPSISNLFTTSSAMIPTTTSTITTTATTNPFAAAYYNGLEQTSPYTADQMFAQATTANAPAAFYYPATNLVNFNTMDPTTTKLLQDVKALNGDNSLWRGRQFPDSKKDILKSWFIANRAFPYPTHEEKQKLAIETGLTLQQISDWFSNARRRVLPKIKPRNNTKNRSTPDKTLIVTQPQLEIQRTTEPNPKDSTIMEQNTVIRAVKRVKR